jgi:hypothetical protein
MVLLLLLLLLLPAVAVGTRLTSSADASSAAGSAVPAKLATSGVPWREHGSTYSTALTQIQGICAERAGPCM